MLAATGTPDAFSAFFDRPADRVAPDLIGWTLCVDAIGGVVVETEAYRSDDEASHSFRGQTARNRAMFGAPATAYVYRIYGLHLCLNVVCGHAGAVLVRAIDPVCGLGQMAARRGTDDVRLLCSGPGRLGQALSIDLSMNGARLDQSPFRLDPVTLRPTVLQGPRIGITRAREKPWRFGLAGSGFLSRPFPADRIVNS